jgi:hypothetical protein
MGETPTPLGSLEKANLSDWNRVGVSQSLTWGRKQTELPKRRAFSF